MLNRCIAVLTLLSGIAEESPHQNVAWNEKRVFRPKVLIPVF